MVDTGSQLTTISVRDSTPFYDTLPQPSDSTSTPAGSIPTSVIFNCQLAFDLLQSIHVEKLRRINILNPPEPTDDMKMMPSVLGMDILGRYYLYFDSSTVTLEK